MAVTLAVSDTINATSSELEVSESVFGQPYNEGLIHQILVAYMAGGRQGSKAQKTRSEVRGGGKKPWRQKGTGRARAGTIRSPIWRSGGVTFAAKPRSYDKKVNKKMYKAAIRNILSELVRQELLQIFSSIECQSPKTKELQKFLDKYEINNALIVLESENQDIFLAARNIPNIEVVDVQAVNPFSLLRHKRVIFTENALSLLNEKLL